MSSFGGSNWSRTIGPNKNPTITITDHDRHIDSDPGTPMVEIGGRRSKGKELASYYLDRTRLKKLPDWHSGNAITAAAPAGTTRSDPKRQLFENYTSRYVPEEPDEPETPITSYREAHRMQSRPPAEVHVLILTWAKHDRRGDDGQLLSPSLDMETNTVRACFKRRGYRVQCRLVPEDYPTPAVETILDRFLSASAPDRLLVIYYHGYGNMENGRMVFSRYFPLSR